MTRPKAGGWIAATVVASLLLAVAAWFLAISPTLASAADTREQTDAQISQNDITRSKIARLKVQFEKIDDLRTQLAALQLQIPTTEEMADFRREIAGAADARGVTVKSLQVGVATGIVPPDTATGTAGTATDATGDSTTTETQAPTPEPTAPADIVFALPITIESLGAYDAVLAFLQDMQANTQRLFFVESLTATSPDPAEASGGLPAIAVGDIDLTITGYVFVLPPLGGAAPTPEPTGTAAPTPTPLPQPNGRNPVLPVP